MAHVMSLAFFPMSIGFMSHVDFKKRPCRPVEIKGQRPQDCGKAPVYIPGVPGVPCHRRWVRGGRPMYRILMLVPSHKIIIIIQIFRYRPISCLQWAHTRSHVG